MVLIDGVGFPAVGSICGTDNAQVCRACSVDENQPTGVVLVGGVGVGGAVDAFNLNATYFSSAKVPVLGAIFNKLPLKGFYSLENCKSQVTSYFDQFASDTKAFGFVPLFPGIVGPDGMDNVEEYLSVFGSHVDIASILQSAKLATGQVGQSGVPVKRRKVASKADAPMRSRKDIELMAIRSGAQKSA